MAAAVVGADCASDARVEPGQQQFSGCQGTPQGAVEPQTRPIDKAITTDEQKLADPVSPRDCHELANKAGLGDVDLSETEGHSDSQDDDERQHSGLLSAVTSEPVDLLTLRSLALQPGGLLKDPIRQRAWPLLLQLSAEPPACVQSALSLTEEQLRAHECYGQVRLDVERTLKRFPPGIDDCVRIGMQESLITLIVRSLAAHPDLHYYQGYHDVAITVLLVCGEDLALPVLAHLASHQLSVFMTPTMEQTQDLLTYMLPVFEAADPPVAEFLVRSEAMATFALPWIITWFSHVLPSYTLITRLFDYVLAAGHMAPVYLSAAVVLHRRDELLAVDCDLAAVHSLLANIPPHLPWERLLLRSSQLLHQLPPEQLQPRVDALNRARRQGEQEERERLKRRREAAERRRRGGVEDGWWVRRLVTRAGAPHWTLVGVTLGVALLAVTVHYWRLRAQ